MEKCPRAQYSPEFREQAVRTYRGSGLTLEAAAKRLSLLKGTLKNWIYAADQGKLTDIGKHQKPLTEMELELSRLKRELAETKMERDFIKKCAAYFAKEERSEGCCGEIWSDRNLAANIPSCTDVPRTQCF